MSNPDPPCGQPTSAARAQTLPLQGLVNRVNGGLLRTPLLCRLVGRRLLTVYLVGIVPSRLPAPAATGPCWPARSLPGRATCAPANRCTSVSPASGDPPMSMSWPTRPAPSGTWH